MFLAPVFGRMNSHQTTIFARLKLARRMYDLSLESCSHVTDGYDKQKHRSRIYTTQKKKTAESLLFSGLLYLTPGKYRRNEAVSVVYVCFFEHVSWKFSTLPIAFSFKSVTPLSACEKHSTLIMPRHPPCRWKSLVEVLHPDKIFIACTNKVCYMSPLNITKKGRLPSF